MSRDVAVPLSLTVLFHTLLVVALYFHLDFAAEMPEVKPTPHIIQAKLIAMNANAVARSKPVKKPAEPASEPESTPPPAPEPAPEPVKPTPPPPPQKKEPDTQKLLKLKQAEEAQKKVADEKAKADAKKIEDQKKADDAKKTEELKKAAELKKKAEADKKLKEQKDKEAQDNLNKQREKAARAELAKSLSEDEEAQSTNTEGQLVQSYQGLIQEAVQRRWSRPPSARNGMHCVLVIQLIPTGELVDVQILKSSGDDAFDRSALNAARKAAPFTELSKLSKSDPRVFEQQFRRFNLDFIPEDLRQ